MAGSHDLGEGEPVPSGMSVSAAVDQRPKGLGIDLKTRAEFQRAAKGRRLHAKCLTLQAFRRSEDDVTVPRFGLTVTKRVGNAVERNRIKRRFRATLRVSGLPAQPFHDYVIVARREALTAPFLGLAADLAKTLNQARTGRSSGRQGKGADRRDSSV